MLEQELFFEYDIDETSEAALQHFLSLISFRKRVGKKEIGMIDRAMAVFRAGQSGLCLKAFVRPYSDCMIRDKKLVIGDAIFDLPRAERRLRGTSVRAYVYAINAGKCHSEEGMDELLAHMWGTSFALAGQTLIQNEISRLEDAQPQSVITPIWLDSGLHGKKMRQAAALHTLLDVSQIGMELDAQTNTVNSRGLGGIALFSDF